MKLKKTISVLLVFAVLCGFACCFSAAAEGRVIGKAYISFEDRGERTEVMVRYPTAIGTIYGQAQVDVCAGDTVEDLTVRFLESVKGARALFTDTRGKRHLAAIQNVITDSGVALDSFGDYDAGMFSGWMFRVNNQFTNDPTNVATVDIGDELCWVYTCQEGADIGGNKMETSAAITGLKFSSGTLSPAFTTAVKDYTLKLEKNVLSVKVEVDLKDYFTEATYTLVHNGRSVSYKYYRDMPVENGDKIIIETKKVTDLYDPLTNVRVDTKTDSDRVTVTIEQEQGKPLDFIHAFFQMIIDFIKGLFTKLGG